MLLKSCNIMDTPYFCMDNNETRIGLLILDEEI